MLKVELTVRTALIAIGTIGSVWLLLQLWQILLVIVVALMLVGMLNPFVERLERRGLKRSFSIGIVFGAIFAVVGAASALLLPRLVTEVRDLYDHFPDARENLAKRLDGASIAAPLANWIRTVKTETLQASAKEVGLSYGPKVFEVVAYTLSAFFLALYVIIDRDRMRGMLFALFPRKFHVRVSRVLLNLERIVGGYMRGQVITSGLMAGFTLVVLLVARVPNALAIALYAGLVDVLPYVGALLACGPAFVAALARGTPTAIVVLLILGAYQEFESRVIVPRIYGKVLRLPPATVMVALLVGGKLLGILGALLALPIAAGIRMVFEELRLPLPGEEADDAVVRAKDAVAEAVFEMRAAGVPAIEAATIATEITEERQAEEDQEATPSSKPPLT